MDSLELFETFFLALELFTPAGPCWSKGCQSDLLFLKLFLHFCGKFCVEAGQRVEQLLHFIQTKTFIFQCSPCRFFHLSRLFSSLSSFIAGLQLRREFDL